MKHRIPPVNSHDSTRPGFDLKPVSFVARCASCAFLLALFCLFGVRATRGEAMLELFNVSWADLTTKMPEIAEAGYDSLWLPNPAKGNSGLYSYGYDQFDPAAPTSRGRLRPAGARRTS